MNLGIVLAGPTVVLVLVLGLENVVEEIDVAGRNLEGVNFGHLVGRHGGDDLAQGLEGFV